MSKSNKNNIHGLVKLHNALVGARCSMDNPRMDVDKQIWDALQSVLKAFDRETERNFTILINRYIEANAESKVVMSEAKQNECTFPLTGLVVVWKRTRTELPCPPGEQAEVLMWSPNWATWIHGMFTHYTPNDGETQEWANYNANDDRYYAWPVPPEWWAKVNTPNKEL